MSVLAEKYRMKGETNPTENWSHLLKAHTLYNSCGSRSQNEKWTKEAYGVQQIYWQGRVDFSTEDQTLETSNFKKELETIRQQSREALKPAIKLSTDWDCSDDKLDSEFNRKNSEQLSEVMRRVSHVTNARMRVYAGKITQKSVEICRSAPPCKFTVVALGSLAKGEATPYSDLEFMFILEKKTPDIVNYFELLAMTMYFLIGNLQETPLKYMNIAELKDFRDTCKSGFKIDGLQSKAGNIPTGNGTKKQNNHLILTVEELIIKYQHILEHPVPEEALIGDFTSLTANTAVVYGAPELLSIFKRARCGMKVSEERKEADFSMMVKDMAKYDNVPAFCRQSGGALSFNAKQDLYRFPSLFLHGWSVPSRLYDHDSWHLLEILADIQADFPTLIFPGLRFLLASALFTRMTVCLKNDSQTEAISYFNQIDVDPKVDSVQGIVWHVPHSLALHMSIHAISVQGTVKSWFRGWNGLWTQYQSAPCYCSNLKLAAAMFYAYTNDFDRAIAIFEKEGMPGSEFEVNLSLTYCYIVKGELAKAKDIIEFFDETANEGMKRTQPGSVEGITLKRYKLCAAVCGRFLSCPKNKTEDEINHLLEECIDAQDTANVFSFADVAIFYLQADDYDKSDIFAKKAINLHHELSLQRSQSSSRSGMTDAFESGLLLQMANVEVSKRKMSNAQRLATRSLHLLDKVYGSNTASLDKAGCYEILMLCSLDKPDKSLFYYKRTLSHRLLSTNIDMDHSHLVNVFENPGWDDKQKEFLSKLGNILH